MAIGTPTLLGSNSASTSSQTSIAVAGCVIPANSLVLVVVHNGRSAADPGDPTSVSDGTTNLVKDIGAGSPGFGHASQWTLYYAAGATKTFTANFAASNATSIYVYSISGAATASFTDTVGSSSSFSSTMPATTAANVAQADELAQWSGSRSAIDALTTFPDTGFTSLVNTTDATWNFGFLVQYQTPLTAGATQTATATLASNQNHAQVIATYKGATAAATGGTVAAPQPMLMTLTRFTPIGVPQLFFPVPAPAPAISQTFVQALTANVVSTGAIVKQVGKLMSVTVVSTAAIVKQVGKPLTATVVSTGTVTRQVGKPLSAPVTTTASIVKKVLKNLSAPVTMTATIALIKVVLMTLSATVVTTASMVRSVGKQLSAPVTTTATVTKKVLKNLSAPVTATATLALIKVVLVTLAATVTTTAKIARQVGKQLTATAPTTATIRRTVSKALSAPVTASGTVTKVIAKTLTAAVATAATLTRFIPSGLVQLFRFDPSGTGRGAAGNPTATSFDAETHNPDAPNASFNDFDPPNPR